MELTKDELKPKFDKASIQIKPLTHDQMAQIFLDALYKVDPAWEERDKACKDEWGLAPAQRLLKHAAIALNLSLHLEVMAGYEFMVDKNTDPVNPALPKCAQCHKEFTPKSPGQTCCSNECGEAHFGPPKRKIAEYDPAFEQFVESQANQELALPDGMDMRQVAMPVSGTIR